MGARKDADRIVALVVAVEALARGERQTLGELASAVFGWDINRVFLAVDAAIATGKIAKNGPDGAISANDNAPGGR